MKKMVGDILITDELFRNGIRVYQKAERTFVENENDIPISFICQVIPKPPILNELQDQFERLKKISDKNIIKYYEFKETDHNYYIFMEKMNQDVFETIIENEFISEDQAKHYLREILNGLKCIKIMKLGLHQNDINYVDLNPKSIFKKNDELKIGQINIYLDQISQLKSDEEFRNFGFVKEIIPPEILSGKTLGSIESDLFAVSCIYFRMLYQRYPFTGETKQELLRNMEKNQIDFTNFKKDISQQSIDFLKQTLKFEPDNRLKWTQVYCHPLLQLLNIPNQHMAQSLLLSISMSKMMFRQDLTNKDFDIQKNQKFYEQKIEEEKEKSQIRLKSNQKNEQSTFFMNICQEHEQEEIKQIKQSVNVLESFFSEQRTKLLQEQIDFYLQQRNIYSSLCQSLTYVRLFDSEFKSQLLEYLILKIIYLLASSLSNQLNEFAKLLEKWKIEQNLKDQFQNLQFKIEKENSIIQQQFDKFHNMQIEKVRAAEKKGKQMDEKIKQILNKEQQFQVYESFFTEMKKFIENSVTFELWKKKQEALIHQINLQLILSFSLLISYFLKWEPKKILEKSQAEYQDFLIKQNDLQILKQEQENKLSQITQVFSQFKENQKQI